MSGDEICSNSNLFQTFQFASFIYQTKKKWFDYQNTNIKLSINFDWYNINENVMKIDNDDIYLG